jgi:aminomethyltransferase
MEWITPASLHSLGLFSSTLSVILNEQGGIIDDTVICKHAPTKYYIVTNAARRDRDITWIEDKLVEWNARHSNKDPVTLTPKFHQGLVALQGDTNCQLPKPDDSFN